MGEKNITEVLIPPGPGMRSTGAKDEGDVRGDVEEDDGRDLDVDLEDGADEEGEGVADGEGLRYEAGEEADLICLLGLFRRWRTESSGL